jgi:hypothetical protein
MASNQKLTLFHQRRLRELCNDIFRDAEIAARGGPRPRVLLLQAPSGADRFRYKWIAEKGRITNRSSRPHLR